jgi:hypothetical protein
MKSKGVEAVTNLVFLIFSPFLFNKFRDTVASQLNT